MLATLESVSKTYRTGFRRQTTALEDVSFGIVPGSLTGIVGPNGSGKSTSIKALLGLIQPTSGRALLFGELPHGANVFRQVGYLPENVALTDTLKSREILGYFAAVHGISGRGRTRRIDELLEQVGLAAHTSKTVRQYSKGMMQRLALACALIHDPEFLILDEPMSGLDPIGRRFVIDLLAQLHHAGKTICFSSHVLHDIEELCDRLVVIYRGRVRFDGMRKDFTHTTSNCRIVYSAVIPPSGYDESVRLGPQTWEMKATYERAMDLIQRLPDSGATLIEFSQTGSLEASFFDLVKS